MRKAERDLERTKIFAPYDAIVAKTYTEVGSYLVPGAQIAEVYESGPYEVRLPLSVDEASFLQTGPNGEWTGTAEVRATVAGSTRRWKADIIRSEGEFDRDTRSSTSSPGSVIPWIPRESRCARPVRPGHHPGPPGTDVAEISAKAFRVVDQGDRSS